MNTGPSNSTITSAALWIAGVLLGWLASHGVIPAADVTKDTVIVGGFIVIAVSAAIGWFKAHQVTQDKLIQAVNKGDNGVTAVASSDARSAGILPVNAALK